MKIVLTVILSILSISAIACEVAPKEQTVSAIELINRTESIVLAKVVSATSSEDAYVVTYKFKTIEMLKGKKIDTFQINGHPLYQGGMQNFNHHSDAEFWKDYRGRVSNDTDCKIHPGFSVGAIFLVFSDQPYHNKSFENIIRTHGNKDTKDKWLQYVEEQIGHNKSLNLTPKSGAN